MPSPPRLTPSTSGQGLNFTAQMRALCVDICTRLPELTHVDMGRVAIRFCQTRTAAGHGVQASLTPLRFQGGSLETQRRGRRWTIQRVRDHSGQEMLYLLSFYVPRFLNHPFEEKLATVIHELWHINPAFDGDLRRHEGRCYAHGSSEARYHAAMHELARRWLSFQPPEALYDFLHGDFSHLLARFGRVFGTRIPTPRLLPLGSR